MERTPSGGLPLLNPRVRSSGPALCSVRAQGGGSQPFTLGCQSRSREKMSPHGHELSRDDPAEPQQTVRKRSQPASERELPTLTRP